MFSYYVFAGDHDQSISQNKVNIFGWTSSMIPREKLLEQYMIYQLLNFLYIT